MDLRHNFSMKRNNLALIIISLLSLSFLSLGFLFLKSAEKTCPVPRECEKCVVKTDNDSESIVIKAVGANNPMLLHGKLVKEAVLVQKIVESQELIEEGVEEEEEVEDVYFLEFENQHLLVNNSTGVPVYIERIQLIPPVNKDLYDMEDFVEKKVEVYGYQNFVLNSEETFQVLSVKSN
jgi:hypothetical protein